jgi:hypothetical protein
MFRKPRANAGKHVRIRRHLTGNFEPVFIQSLG